MVLKWQSGKVPKIVTDGMSRLQGMHRDVFLHEPMVECSESARAIGLHHILVVLAYLNSNPSLIPYGWVWASLILDANMVTNYWWWEPFLVCSFICLFLKASLWARVSLQVGAACSGQAGWV